MPLSSKHLVDPELIDLLYKFPPLSLTPESLTALRGNPPSIGIDRLEDDAVSIVHRDTPEQSAAPPVKLVIYAPRNGQTPKPCILHIHGGGFVAGSALIANPALHRMSQIADCVIVSIDYRLAPEHRYPASLEDCYAALSWVYANAAGLGIDCRQIGVMGDSAGGGLAAALALLARDRGRYVLRFQHLVSPMLDDRTCIRGQENPWNGEFVWTLSNNEFGWRSLLGEDPGSDAVCAYAAPARASDLSGLPPAFIAVGALDLFLEEDVSYALRLMRSGVPVELHVYPGAYHSFEMSDTASVAVRAQRDSLEALRRALHS